MIGWVFQNAGVGILLRSTEDGKPDRGGCFMIGLMSSLKSLFIVERSETMNVFFRLGRGDDVFSLKAVA